MVVVVGLVVIRCRGRGRVLACFRFGEKGDKGADERAEELHDL